MTGELVIDDELAELVRRTAKDFGGTAQT